LERREYYNKIIPTFRKALLQKMCKQHFRGVDRFAIEISRNFNKKKTKLLE
jgi:hypothetical protein